MASNPLLGGTARKAAAAMVVAFALASLTLASLASAGATSSSDVLAVDNNNNLIRFDPATPGTIQSSIPITGLQPGEQAFDVDLRPDTNRLYVDTAIFGDPNQINIYNINPATGSATQVGSSVTDSPSFASLDFDPVADHLRFVNVDDENLRIDPDDGTVNTDTPVAYAAGDTNEGADPGIVGAAYINNFPGATATGLYNIDTTLDILVQQFPPDNGTLHTVGDLGVSTDEEIGFDIGSNGTFYTSLTTGGTSSLHTIDPITGAATLVGAIDDSGTAVTQPIQGITVAPDFEPPTVQSVKPAHRAQNVKLETKVTVVFSDPIDESTVTTKTIKLVDTKTGTKVRVAISCGDPCTTVTIDPAKKLTKNRTYQLKIEGGGDADVLSVEDTAGNELATDFTSTFKTKK
jgi:hypothetical protein